MEGRKGRAGRRWKLERYFSILLLTGILSGETLFVFEFRFGIFVTELGALAFGFTFAFAFGFALFELVFAVLVVLVFVVLFEVFAF